MVRETITIDGTDYLVDTDEGTVEEATDKAILAQRLEEREDVDGVDYDDHHVMFHYSGGHNRHITRLIHEMGHVILDINKSAREDADFYIAAVSEEDMYVGRKS